MPLLLDRIKQSMASCKVSLHSISRFERREAPIRLRETLLLRAARTQEAAAFLRKRAVLEDEYGKQMQKLSRASSTEYATTEGKAG